jgi:transcriptional regulator with PAS, ATPase and Fis domain
MGSRLKEFQQYMIKYTETIASVLDIDIEIVDDRLMRISGSGIYKSKIDESVVTEGYIYNKVIVSGEQMTVLDICDSDVCVECDHYQTCLNKVIIAVPIKYNDNHTIGVIGAISTVVNKKKEIKNKLESYTTFINHISDLISMKMEEFEISDNNDKMITTLTEILDHVEKGVVILDSNSHISYINNIALKKMGIKNDALDKLITIKLLETFSNGKELVEFKIGKEVFNITSKKIHVYPYVPTFDRILVFDKTYAAKQGTEINSGWGYKNIDSIIGSSEAIKKVKQRTKRLAKSNSTVLITGESGTGKELIAKAIHSEGDRWNKPFIALNCAAIPENLLESELFGYSKGAFSGASSSGKVGKFELANEGVIFLDEIGDLPMHLQAKLLRVLQERKFARVGSNKLIDLDIRVITATNKNLLHLVNEGEFREDLYYRINVIPINLPPLRERKEDIEDMMMMFVSKYSVELDKHLNEIRVPVMDMLINYNWPGNVRELENAVEYMMNLVDDEGTIYKDMLPVDILNYYREEVDPINGKSDVSLPKSINSYISEVSADLLENEESIIKIKDLELMYINKLLDKYGRDTKTKKLLAKKLGIGLATLYRKLEDE